LLVFLIGTLLLFLILSLFDSRFLAAASLGPLGLIFGVSVLFLAGFYTLGLMVSAFCHSTRTAIVALLVVWVLLQLVIPKAGEMIAKVISPVRSEEAVRVEKAAVMADLQDRQLDRGGEMFQRIFGTDQLNSGLVRDDTPEGQRFRQEYQALTEELWQEQNTRLRAVDQAYEREQLSQRRLASSLALLSPAAAYGFLVSDAAGTGDLAYAQYLVDVDNYHNILDRTVLSKLRDAQVKIRVGQSSFWMTVGDRPDWEEEVPTFETTALDQGQVIQANAWGLVSLFAYVLIPFALAYVAFLRYDVR
jgi:ABC-type transport system involved in multi-copper enzyme maturation permease subunit